MFEDLFAQMADYLIPLPIPVLLIGSLVLGALAVPYLLYGDKEATGRLVRRREAVLGFCLLNAVFAFLVWLSAAALVYSHLPDESQNWTDFALLAACGILYGASVFGFVSFAMAIANMAIALLHSVRTEFGPAARERARRADQERIQLQQRREQEWQRSEALKLRQQDAAQRRKEAHSQCELAFSFYQADIERRFTRVMFNDYLAKYMGESEDPETVERRGRELRSILQKHYEQVIGKTQPTTLAELAGWFVDEKEQISQLDIDDDLKETHLIQLDMRYAELSQEILEAAKP